MKKFFVITMLVLIIAIISTSLLTRQNKKILPQQVAITTTENYEIPQTLAKPQEKTVTEISFWAFPVGSFVDKALVESFIAEFNKIYPNIKVDVKTLDYASGDKKIEEAIEARKAPDIVMEGPERLVANWGARGLLIDLRDLWDEETTSNIAAVSQRVVDACRAPDGAFYEYPMVMTTHVMAINYEVFEKAGALKYIDKEQRSWTTQDFVLAMQAVRDSKLVKNPGIIYTGGQGGDQGTRALVSNLFNAPFTNIDHTAYTINSQEGIEGLTLLQKMVSEHSLAHNSQIAAAEELKLFANEDIAITLAWNATNELYYAKQVKFTPYAMNFPSSDGIAELQGGIWGFGIFNKGNQAKIDAAKKLIKFMVDNPEQRHKSVIASQFFPVNIAYTDVYKGTKEEERMSVYASFLPNLGDYYQITPAWPQQRIEWYKMLQKVFSGVDAKTAADNYVNILINKVNP